MKLFGRAPDLDAAREKRDFRALADALASETPELREKALSVIIELGDSGAIEPVLAKYGSLRTTTRIEKDLSYADGCERMLVALDPESTVLIQMLGSKGARDRRCVGVGKTRARARTRPASGRSELAR